MLIDETYTPVQVFPQRAGHGEGGAAGGVFFRVDGVVSSPCAPTITYSTRRAENMHADKGRQGRQDKGRSAEQNRPIKDAKDKTVLPHIATRPCNNYSSSVIVFLESFTSFIQPAANPRCLSHRAASK